MTHWELIDTQERDGFTIELHFAPEDDDPRGHFDDDGETAEAIHNGDYLWFVARVTVSKAGIDLGTDYLGGCCYESAADFMEEGGYYADMIEAAMDDARAALESLKA